MHASTTSILIAALASSSLAAPIFQDLEALNAPNLAARNVFYQLATRDTPSPAKQNEPQHSGRSVEEKDELDERDLEDFPEFDERDEDNYLDERASPFDLIRTAFAKARTYAKPNTSPSPQQRSLDDIDDDMDVYIDERDLDDFPEFDERDEDTSLDERGD
ncbi:hypothetical protein DACRYDRAFT_13459 [Dacryopinax primogenitus]|uniref:Uncharacterized protein n=1 Tax=Dacryopinax primogenitus (strain DJM 731) TaxID=1858805 RepID=M5G5B4_DACPD|nr:uncharacterized protein DACRYDRAFT_13459 [Dacryopinax primogenitus]EJU05446.1 hypothetical protein DACRYDRAFT_13459 [Dacryopinax primogenitus]